MQIKILMIGFGNVGQGFAQLLVKKKEFLQATFGLDFRVIGIVTRRWKAITDANGLDLNRVLDSVRSGLGFAKSGYEPHDDTPLDLITKLDYHVLAELSVTDLRGGLPATDYIRKALNAGHSVVTANKGPIALNLDELLALAQKRGVALRYEGTVLSGTPLINLLQTNLAGAEIKKIQGIMNGSTNYILTRMEEGLEYDEALEEAKRLGYLEADPSADVDGWDAAAKGMILAQAVFGQKVGLDAVKRKGITELRRGDIQRAKKEHEVWKLITTVERKGDGVAVSVWPERLKDGHPLAPVRGAMNAVVISTDALNEVTIMGPGAGGIETGFAVLNDLLAVSKQRPGIDSNQSPA